MYLKIPLAIFIFTLIYESEALFTDASIFDVLYTSRSVLNEGIAYENAQVRDPIQLLREYDFIVVGGGTAGCVVANRLSENPDHTVLLLEAGRTENYLMTVPALMLYFQQTEINWGHRSVPQSTACLSMKDGRCPLPRGKVFGGSGVLNGAFFTRGNRKDYDRWRDLGNPGWGYDDLLPYFKRIEDVNIPEFKNSPFRGKNGPLEINIPAYRTPLGKSFLEAVQLYGYDIIDINGETETGFNYIQHNMKNGTKMSSNRAYLMPIKYRSNLHVKKLSTVSKVLINPIDKQAYGVEFINKKRKWEVYAKKEVILSAGAYNSPQILMLSGIGPSEHLNSLGIPIIQDLKVGYNLQDHIEYGGLIFTINQPLSFKATRLFDRAAKNMIELLDFGTGPLASVVGAEGIGFINTKWNNETSDYPDMEIQFFTSSITASISARQAYGIREDIYNIVYRPIENRDVIQFYPMILRPESKGRITLRSRNPLEYPNILHNYLVEDIDVERILEGLKFAIKLAESKPFKKYGTRLHDIPIPGCRQHQFNTDNYWRCAIRHITFTSHHQCGTAKMGPQWDINAVVDPELRVYGVKGLRVIDASIMPFNPTCHINAVVYMLAEKGSDMIKDSWRMESYGYNKK